MATPLRKSDVSQDQPTIVQCPSCQTKFAVETSLLEGVASPRFHCSRCDHVFVQGVLEQVAPASPLSCPVTPEASTAALEIDDTPAPELPVEEVSEQGALFGVRDSGGMSVGMDGTVRSDDAPSVEDFPPIENEATRKERSPAWSLRNSAAFSRGLEIPRSIDAKHPFSAPHENLPSFEPSRDLARPGREFAASQLEMPLATRTDVDDPRGGDRSSFQLAQRREPEESERSGALGLSAPRWSLSHRAAGSSRPSVSEASSQWLQASLSEMNVANPPAQRGRGFFWLVLPVVAFLFLLGGITLVGTSSDTIASRLTEVLYPSSPHVAPPGLEIQGVQFKRVALDSGDVIPLISGRIFNGSEERLRQVIIDGLLFDDQGRMVASARVNAASTLVKTRIKSLTTDIIRGFQSGQVVKRFDLKPGEQHEFSIALLPESSTATGSSPREALAGARFFSVRLVSAN